MQVPSWPVIRLEQQGADVVARWPLGEVRADASEVGTEEAARQAAVEAATRLGVDVCRVQGLANESEWPMVVDVDAGTLEELRDDVAPSGGWSRRTKIIAAAVVAAIAIPAGVGVETWVSGTNLAPETVEAAPETPAPAQLPVYAPDGWDTYASWVVPLESPGPVLAGETGTVTIADDDRLVTMDAATGVEIAETSTGSTVTALHQNDAGVMYAAHGREGVAIVEGEASTDVPIDDASEIILGDTPVAVLSGQRAAVLVDATWQERIVPAGGTVVGAIGAAVVVVDVDQASVWLIEGTDPELPEPYRLGGSEGTALERVLAFVDGHLVTAWEGLDSNTIRTDVVSREGLEPAASATTAASIGGSVSVDEPTMTLAVGRVLLEIDSGEIAEASQAGLVAIAGFGWTDGLRIAIDGTETTSRDGAAIPAAVLPDGTALVVAEYGDTEALYRLVTAEEEE